jgi:DNA-binding GntR family transcriptional regulator
MEAGRLAPERRPPDALPPGSALPTVKGLAAHYQASDETAHKAVRRLAAGGFIHTRAGRPPIVADNRPLWIIRGTAYDRSQREDPAGLTTFEQQCRERGMAARTIHRAEADAPVPEHAADLLGEDRATHLSGEGYVTPMGTEGTPDGSAEYVAGIYDAWVPTWVTDEVPQLLGPRDETNRTEWIGGLDSVIERGIGATLVTRRLLITGRTSTEEEAERFGLPRPAPVMIETFGASDAQGRVLHVTHMLKLMGTVVWDLTLPIGE